MALGWELDVGSGWKSSEERSRLPGSPPRGKTAGDPGTWKPSCQAPPRVSDVVELGNAWSETMEGGQGWAPERLAGHWQWVGTGTPFIFSGPGATHSFRAWM